MRQTLLVPLAVPASTSNPEGESVDTQDDPPPAGISCGLAHAYVTSYINEHDRTATCTPSPTP